MLKNILVTWFICIAISSLGLAQLNVKLRKTTLSDEAHISLPDVFVPMTDQDYREKYMSAKMPLAKYTDRNRVIDFTYTVAVNEWQDEDLQMLLTFNKSNITNLHSKVEFLQESVYKQKKRSYAALEFISTMSDAKGTASKYQYLVYSVRKKKIHIFSMVAPIREREQWQGAIQKSMRTATVLP
jgi:hypothetical protein